MAVTKEKKISLVKDLNQRLQQAVTVVFVSFRGLAVGPATELRKELRRQEVGFVVAKKTLLRRALAEQTVSGKVPDLPGEIAFAYGQDQLAPARGIYQFDQKYKDTVKIVGGILSGVYADAATMLALATIPGREILLGKLVNIINSPIQRFVIALDQIAKNHG